MEWMTAAWRGTVVVLYFVITTVWLPDFIIGLGAVAEAPAILRDTVILVVWGTALGAGIYLLRRFQRQGLI